MSLTFIIAEEVGPEKSVDFLDKESNACSSLNISMTVDANQYYNTNFVISIVSQEEEGLYNLYFHSCPNYKDEGVFVDFTVRQKRDINK